uniref:Uncharacterized protein n=1 Tax=Romanomermis culicivorax TaxID=13658 RepID=A0A915IXG3_ROMCU
EYNHEENAEKIGTLEEELEKGREACNKDFIEIKANPSIITMQKIYHDFNPEVVSQKYAKLFKNYIRFCKEVFGSTEPAPEEKHLQSIKDSKHIRQNGLCYTNFWFKKLDGKFCITDASAVGDCASRFVSSLCGVPCRQQAKSELKTRLSQISFLSRKDIFLT